MFVSSIVGLTLWMHSLFFPKYNISFYLPDWSLSLPGSLVHFIILLLHQPGLFGATENRLSKRGLNTGDIDYFPYNAGSNVSPATTPWGHQCHDQASSSSLRLLWAVAFPSTSRARTAPGGCAAPGLMQERGSVSFILLLSERGGRKYIYEPPDPLGP